MVLGRRLAEVSAHHCPGVSLSRLEGVMVRQGAELPLRSPEGVPGPPGAPQDEAGLTRKFETSHVGGHD